MKGVKPGDKAAARLLNSCGECYYCRSGHENLCVASFVAHTHSGIMGAGGFAEYMTVSAKAVYKLADDVDLDHAALAEPLACCVHSIRNARIQLGDDVVVIGAGIMGALHIRLAKMSGARVIVSELDPVRMDVARKMGADIVIATPGRLLAHMKMGYVDLSRVSFFVLDEADRMLDMGFIHDVTRILDKIPSRRNLGMFSATISREVMDISWVYQRDPEEITVRADEQNKPDILQYAVTVEQTDKVAAMARIIRQEKLERVMVFCNTKGMVERLTKYLEMEGLDAACIHGDIPQKKREQVMARFRRGELPVFVATDVAARGIDVDDVDAVFNYDVPQENEYYVHRIGRTGRAKRHGVAYTLVADYPSKMRLDAIAKFTGNDVKPAHFEGDTLVVDAK